MNVLKQDMPEQVWEPLLYTNSSSVHFMTEENLKRNHIKLQATNINYTGSVVGLFR